MNRHQHSGWASLTLSLILSALGGAFLYVSTVLNGLDFAMLRSYVQILGVTSLHQYDTVRVTALYSLPFAATGMAVILFFWLPYLAPHTDLVLQLWAGRRQQEFRLKPPRWVPVLLSVLLLAGSLLSLALAVRLPQYLARKAHDSTLYAEEYYDPQSQGISFPEKKRNLIHIFLESMETTYEDPSSGGLWPDNLIPGLTKLSHENLCFSDMFMISGAYNTVSALVAQTCGLPLTVTLTDAFLPGVCSLGDILKEEGYQQTFMCGSDAAFSNRDRYFSQHGYDFIWDYDTAVELGIVDPDFAMVNDRWGIDDQLLFEQAKTVLTDLAAGERPFNLTLLTVDTHFYDGVLCSNCGEQYGTQYENVLHCSDELVSRFVAWLQEQDFYENTTVIITGDHLYMDNRFLARKDIDQSARRIYNCILNPAEGLASPITDRQFSSLDVFPTILRAIGATWESQRLGLGTDLFSDQQTLLERMGREELNAQLDGGYDEYLRLFACPDG